MNGLAGQLSNTLGCLRAGVYHRPVRLMVPVFINTLPLLYFATSGLTESCEAAHVISWDNLDWVRGQINGNRNDAFCVLLDKEAAKPASEDSSKGIGFASHTTYRFEVSKYSVAEMVVRCPGMEARGYAYELDEFFERSVEHVGTASAVIVRTDAASLAKFFLQYIYSRWQDVCRLPQVKIYKTERNASKYCDYRLDGGACHVYLYSAHRLHAVNFLIDLRPRKEDFVRVRLPAESFNHDAMSLNAVICLPERDPREFSDTRASIIGNSLRAFYSELIRASNMKTEEEETFEGVSNLFNLLIEDDFPLIEFFRCGLDYSKCFRQHVVGLP